MSTETLTTEDAKELAIDEMDAALNRCGLMTADVKAEMCIALAVAYFMEACNGITPDCKLAFMEIVAEAYDSGAVCDESERELDAAVKNLVHELSE